MNPECGALALPHDPDAEADAPPPTPADVKCARCSSSTRALGPLVLPTDGLKDVAQAHAAATAAAAAASTAGSDAAALLYMTTLQRCRMCSTVQLPVVAGRLAGGWAGTPAAPRVGAAPPAPVPMDSYWSREAAHTPGWGPSAFARCPCSLWRPRESASEEVVPLEAIVVGLDAETVRVALLSLFVRTMAVVAVVAVVAVMAVVAVVAFMCAASVMCHHVCIRVVCATPRWNCSAKPAWKSCPASRRLRFPSPPTPPPLRSRPRALPAAAAAAAANGPS